MSRYIYSSFGGCSEERDLTYLDDDGCVVSPPLGCSCTSSIFNLGITSDSAATEHYGDELGEAMSEFQHERFIRRAIELAANVPDLPFGAVIVDRESGEIIAEGWNKSSVNPTWHGEIDAINRLAELRPEFDGSRLSLYSTAEPCPMCQSAILWSGIEIVVYGSSIRFLQTHGWRQIDILSEEVVQRSPGWRCTLIGGILEQECNALFLAASRNDAG